MKSALDPAGRSGYRPGPDRAVLFDLDGTLVDTAPDIAAAVNRTLADLGRPAYPVARIVDWMGEGAPRLVRRALAGGREDLQPPAEDLERALGLFREHYAAAICVHSRPYPHTRRVLDSLREARIRLGCVSNKPERLTRLLLDALALTPLFEVVVGGDTLEFSKPHPGPIRHACRRLDISPTNTVYVGDSPTDCRAAEAAGVRMVAVTYGYHRGVDLTKGSCAAMIDGLDELLETLDRV